MPSHRTPVPPRKPPPLWRKPAWVNAVPATVVQLVQPAKPVATVAMVSTVWPASPVTAVHQLHQRQNWCPKSQTNARAKLHQAMLALQDPRDPTDQPAMLVHQALMASQETKEHADHPAHPAHPALQETRAQLVTLARSLVPDQAQPAHQAQLANQARPVPQANPAMLAMMATPVAQAPLAMLVPQAAQAKLAAPVPQETPARPAHPAAASTAHRLVWLQVIKHLRTVWTGSHQASYPYLDTNQFGVTAPLNAFHFFKTFHVKKMSFSLANTLLVVCCTIGLSKQLWNQQ